LIWKVRFDKGDSDGFILARINGYGKRSYSKESEYFGLESEMYTDRDRALGDLESRFRNHLQKKAASKKHRR